MRLAFAIATVLLVAPVVQAQSPPSLAAGAYTNAQADRGFSAFMKSCSKCHGADLQGLEAPPLSGATFMSRWQGHSVDELFEHTLDFMPADEPRSLDPPTVADLMAYVLQFNGYPAGDTELPTGSSALRSLRLTPLPRRSDPGAQVVDH